MGRPIASYRPVKHPPSDGLPVVANGTADNRLGKIQQTGLAAAVDAYALRRKPEAA